MLGCPYVCRIFLTYPDCSGLLHDVTFSRHRYLLSALHLGLLFFFPTVAPGVFKKDRLSADERTDLYDVNFDHAIFSSTFSVLLFPSVTVARAVSCQAPFAASSLTLSAEVCLNGNSGNKQK